MTLARTWAVALAGIEGHVVEVEADLSNSLPAFVIIGLGDKALAEAQMRVRNATANSGIPLPDRRLTVNLSPASLPKHGSGFDVAIAVAAIATTGALRAQSIAETVHVGELGLDGRLRPVAGVLPAVFAAARAGRARAVVPWENEREARLVTGIDVVGAAWLDEVLALHGADPDVLPERTDARAFAPPESPDEGDARSPDLAEVIGQEEAVEALTVAAAGGHHVLMSGPPGAGKTMLAERLPGILPPLDDDAALQVAAIRSLSGRAVTTLSRVPPFEAPHHSASVAALVGGGSGRVVPGSIARASAGVLFLDEALEHAARSLDALRQPLETGRIAIHRAGVSAEFPARFQLVLATNPCPCGQHGVPGGECTCPPMAVRRYRARLSGPLLDRIDIQLSMRRVSRADGAPGAGASATTAHARARVAEARARAAARWAGTPWTTNAQIAGVVLRGTAHSPDTEARRPLDRALERGLVTLRGYDRALRVAWTLADLAGRDRPGLDDVGRALLLRKGAQA